MSRYFLPATFEQINSCSLCKELNIINRKEHYITKHPLLVVYHINKQMLEWIKRTQVS